MLGFRKKKNEADEEMRKNERHAMKQESKGVQPPPTGLHASLTATYNAHAAHLARTTVKSPC